MCGTPTRDVQKSVENPKQPYKSLGSSDDCLCRELSAGSFSFIMGFSPCLRKKIIVLIVVMLPTSLSRLLKKNEDQKHQKCSEKCLKMDQVGSGKSLTGIGKIIYVSLASTKRCFWGTWVLTDEIQAAKWRILVLSTGQSSWRTQARVLNSALRALDTFKCAYQLFLKLFFESKIVWSYLWKCDVYLCLEVLWGSSLWAWWSREAAVAVNSCELTHGVMAGFGEPLWQCLAVRGGISICRKEWLGMAGEWREKAVVVPSRSARQVSYFLSSPSKDAPCWHMCFHLHCSMFARGQLLL